LLLSLLLFFNQSQQADHLIGPACLFVLHQDSLIAYLNNRTITTLQAIVDIPACSIMVAFSRFNRSIISILCIAPQQLAGEIS